MKIILQYTGLSLLVLFVSYGLVAVLKKYFQQFLLDIPNDRSSHNKPTPRGGGIAIAIVVFVGLLGVSTLTKDWSWPMYLGFMAGGLIITMVSLYDDMHSLPMYVRFFVHSICACIVIFSIGNWEYISAPIFGSFALGWLGVPITFLWIVGLINAYNFMDGIDGIAASQAVIAGLGWAIIGYLANLSMVVGLGALIGISSLGFLLHNWPPARIFMGDVGSAFLGYALAVLPIIYVIESTNQTLESRIPLSAFILMGVFVFDSVFTRIRRLVHGKNVWAPHRTHLYQRLTTIGYSHRFVTLLYIVLGLIFLFFALSLIGYFKVSGILILIMAALLLGALWLFVVNEEQKHNRYT